MRAFHATPATPVVSPSGWSEVRAATVPATWVPCQELAVRPSPGSVGSASQPSPSRDMAGLETKS